MNYRFRVKRKYYLQGLPGSISAGRSHALHCVAEGRSCPLSQILSIYTYLYCIVVMSYHLYIMVMLYGNITAILVE